MRRLTLSLFMVFACAMQAEAEPTSIRCDGKSYQQQQPYFVTYDLETKHFVFERAGGNIVTGEIIAANDAQLDFSLRATGGRILTTAANELARRDGKYALVSICAAGAMAGAFLLSRR